MSYFALYNAPLLLEQHGVLLPSNRGSLVLFSPWGGGLRVIAEHPVRLQDGSLCRPPLLALASFVGKLTDKRQTNSSDKWWWTIKPQGLARDDGFGQIIAGMAA